MSENYRYRVRFHLARGENYMKWQITDTHFGRVMYFNPDNVELVMFNCRLMNQRGTANKIHEGANKTVCAWIQCKDLMINLKRDIRGLPAVNSGWSERNLDKVGAVSYNPRKAPHWCDENGNNIDKQKVSIIMSEGRGLTRMTKKEAAYA